MKNESKNDRFKKRLTTLTILHTVYRENCISLNLTMRFNTIFLYTKLSGATIQNKCCLPSPPPYLGSILIIILDQFSSSFVNKKNISFFYTFKTGRKIYKVEIIANQTKSNFFINTPNYTYMAGFKSFNVKIFLAHVFSFSQLQYIVNNLFLL